MKPLTMTEEQERTLRALAAIPGSTADLLAEVDALRAKLAEVEGERDRFVEQEAACCPEDVGFPEFIDVLTRKLAASQAEARALRGALSLIADGAADPTPLMAYAKKALATPPGDDAALREVCMKAMEAALKDSYDGAPWTLESTLAMVLGPKATDASEGGNG